MLTVLLFQWWDFIYFYFLYFLEIWKMTKISMCYFHYKNFKDRFFNVGQQKFSLRIIEITKDPKFLDEVSNRPTFQYFYPWGCQL